MATYQVSRPFSVEARLEYQQARPFSAETRLEYQQARPFSVAARQAYQTSKPFSVETRRVYTVSRPFSVGTDSTYRQARPFSVQTRRVYQVSRPFSVQALLVPAGVPLPPSAGGSLSSGSVIITGASMVLKAAGGAILAWDTLSLEEQLDGGWEWAARLPYRRDPDFALDSQFHIFVDDGMGGKLQSPPLIASRPRLDGSGVDGENAQLAGVDLTTWRLGQDGESFATFADTTSASIAVAVATRANIQMGAFPSFEVPKEEVKQSKLMDALLRYLAVAASHYRISEAGKFETFPVSYLAGGGAPLPAGRVERSYDPQNRIGKLRFGKRSEIIPGPGSGPTTKTFDNKGFYSFALDFPLANCIVYDESTNGAVDWVGLWAGDPGSGGKLIRFYALHEQLAPSQLTVPLSGSWPATHVTCVVREPAIGPTSAKLEVTGASVASIPPDQDSSFVWPVAGPYEVPGGGPRSEVFIDPLYPSADWVAARIDQYVYALNRRTDMLQFSRMPLYAQVRIAEGVTQPGWPTARVERVGWSGDQNGYSSEVEATVWTL